MKILFLCAGYGTRLERDLKNSSEFPECIGRPKGLLPVGEKALISYWFDSMKSIKEILSEVIIVTNDKHQEQFHKSKKWYAPNFSKNLKIINDGSTSNETRLGAVSDIKFGLESKYDEDVLVVAGDTLFMEDFNLEDFIKRFNELKKEKENTPLALIVECPCSESEVHKHGIIEVNDQGKVTSFLEKPAATKTKSRSQSPCFYLFDQDCQKLLDAFMEHTKDLPLEKKDATGNFLAFLIPRANVFTYKTKGRYDVGNLVSYKLCIDSFSK